MECFRVGRDFSSMGDRTSIVGIAGLGLDDATAQPRRPTSAIRYTAVSMFLTFHDHIHYLNPSRFDTIIKSTAYVYSD